MKEMTAYAASLTGTTGKALDAETMTVGPKRLIKGTEEDLSKSEKQGKGVPNSKKDEDVCTPDLPTEHGSHTMAANFSKNKNFASNSKKGTKKAAGSLSKKEQMIADNKERKGSTESDKVFTACMYPGSENIFFGSVSRGFPLETFVSGANARNSFPMK
jgi:hypothetical protein